MNSRKPRILLADDHAIVTEGLQHVLEKHFELVGAVEDGRSLLESAQNLQPDVIVADISMPLLNGIEATRQIRDRRQDIKVILLTMHPDLAYVRESFRAGAAGYVLKRSAASELIRAIREVLKGRIYVSPALGAPPLPKSRGSDSASTRRGSLTQRQTEVLQLIAEGLSIKEIAAILHVSPKTIEFHKNGIADRLGLHTTAQLTRYAVKHGIVTS